jgi:hypothetical protein
MDPANIAMTHCQRCDDLLPTLRWPPANAAMALANVPMALANVPLVAANVLLDPHQCSVASPPKVSVIDDEPGKIRVMVL